MKCFAVQADFSALSGDNCILRHLTTTFVELNDHHALLPARQSERCYIAKSSCQEHRGMMFFRLVDKLCRVAVVKRNNGRRVVQNADNLRLSQFHEIPGMFCG